MLRNVDVMAVLVGGLLIAGGVHYHSYGLNITGIVLTLIGSTSCSLRAGDYFYHLLMAKKIEPKKDRVSQQVSEEARGVINNGA